MRGLITAGGHVTMFVLNGASANQLCVERRTQTVVECLHVCPSWDFQVGQNGFFGKYSLVNELST